LHHLVVIRRRYTFDYHVIVAGDIKAGY